MSEASDRAIRAWVDGYVKAWNSNDRDDIGSLFTDDAVYLTEPHATPWEGRDAIVREWIENKDEPGETIFEYDVLCIAGDLGIITGVTMYRDPPRGYSNLWEITLAEDGRASRFVEWWMER